MRADTIRRPLLLAVVAALCGSALIAIIGLVSGEFGDTQLRIILTTISLALAGLLALPGTLLLDRRRLRLLAAADLLLTATALGLILFLIWAEWDEDASDAVLKAFFVSLTLAVASGQASAVESRRSSADSRPVTVLAALSHGTVTVLAAMVVAAVLAEIDDEGYYRALGAIAVADVLFVILPSVIRRFGGAPSAPLRLVCVLEQPAHALPENGYRAREEAPEIVDCAVRARDFAAAAATAIRELERRGARVVRVERSSAE